MASKAAATTKRVTNLPKKTARVTPAKKSTRAVAAKRATPTKPAAGKNKPTKSANRPAAQAARPKKKATPALSHAKPVTGIGASSNLSLDKLHQVALQATNLGEAVDFYQNVLGLRFIARYDPPGLAFFDMGGLRLLLSATASEATLYFRVVDINGAVKILKKRGVSFLQPPAMIHRDESGDFGKKGVEEWMAFFKDPSGNVLALTERR